MSVHLFSRIHTLEGVLVLVGHLVEKLVLCPQRLSQAEPLGTKVGPLAKALTYTLWINPGLA